MAGKKRRGAFKPAGSAWQQQQEQAALLAALMEMPDSEALPVRLLGRLREVFELAARIRIREADEPDEDGGVDGPIGPARDQAGVGEERKEDLQGQREASEAPQRVEQGSHGSGGGPGADAAAASQPERQQPLQPPPKQKKEQQQGSSSSTAPLIQLPSWPEQLSCSCREAVGLLSWLLADTLDALFADGTGPDGNSGTNSSSTANEATQEFATCLMHSYLLLSTATVRGIPGAVCDALALQASWRLPLPLYAGVVHALGWEGLLMEALSWLPHDTATATSAVKPRPAVAAGTMAGSSGPTPDTAATASAAPATASGPLQLLALALEACPALAPGCLLAAWPAHGSDSDRGAQLPECPAPAAQTDPHGDAAAAHNGTCGGAAAGLGLAQAAPCLHLLLQHMRRQAQEDDAAAAATTAGAPAGAPPLPVLPPPHQAMRCLQVLGCLARWGLARRQDWPLMFGAVDAGLCWELSEGSSGNSSDRDSDDGSSSGGSEGSSASVGGEGGSSAAAPSEPCRVQDGAGPNARSSSCRAGAAATADTDPVLLPLASLVSLVLQVLEDRLCRWQDLIVGAATAPATASVKASSASGCAADAHAGGHSGSIGGSSSSQVDTQAALHELCSDLQLLADQVDGCMGQQGRGQERELGQVAGSSGLGLGQVQLLHLKLRLHLFTTALQGALSAGGRGSASAPAPAQAGSPQLGAAAEPPYVAWAGCLQRAGLPGASAGGVVAAGSAAAAAAAATATAMLLVDPVVAQALSNPFHNPYSSTSATTTTTTIADMSGPGSERSPTAAGQGQGQQQQQQPPWLAPITHPVAPEPYPSALAAWAARQRLKLLPLAMAAEEGWARAAVYRRTPPRAWGAYGGGWVHRLSAFAVACLTPGFPCCWPAVTDPGVEACCGTNPWSPLRLALALLSMAQHSMGEESDQAEGAEAASASWATAAAAAAGLAGRGAHVVPLVHRPGLPRLLLHMTTCSMAGVGASRQQAALLQVVRQAPCLGSRLRRKLSLSPALQRPASRALISLSNRLISQEEGLAAKGVLPSPQEEAERLAGLARCLLPFAALAPAAMVARLVADAVHHPGQLRLVVQLLGSFQGVAAAATTATATAAATATAPPSLLVQALRDLLLQGSQPGSEGLTLEPPALAAGSQGASSSGRQGGAATATVAGATNSVKSDLELSEAERQALLRLVPALVAAPSGLLSWREVLAGLVGEPLAAGVEGAQRVRLLLQVAALALGCPLATAASSATVTTTSATMSPPHLAALLSLPSPAQLLLTLSQKLGHCLQDALQGKTLDCQTLQLAAGLVDAVAGAYRQHALSAWPDLPPDLVTDLDVVLQYCLAGSVPRPVALMLLPLVEVLLVHRADPAITRQLTQVLLPASVWRPGSSSTGATAASADNGGGTAVPPSAAAGQLLEALHFAASADTHAAILASLMCDQDLDKGSESEDESESTGPAVAGPRGIPAATLRMLSASARHVAGMMERQLSRAPQAQRGPALRWALSRLLPCASAAQAGRVLGVLLPALALAEGGWAAEGLREWWGRGVPQDVGNLSGCEGGEGAECQAAPAVGSTLQALRGCVRASLGADPGPGAGRAAAAEAASAHRPGSLPAAARLYIVHVLAEAVGALAQESDTAPATAGGDAGSASSSPEWRQAALHRGCSLLLQYVQQYLEQGQGQGREVQQGQGQGQGLSQSGQGPGLGRQPPPAEGVSAEVQQWCMAWVVYGEVLQLAKALGRMGQDLSQLQALLLRLLAVLCRPPLDPTHQDPDPGQEPGPQQPQAPQPPSSPASTATPPPSMLPTQLGAPARALPCGAVLQVLRGQAGRCLGGACLHALLLAMDLMQEDYCTEMQGSGRDS